jgi:hypothetical protein
MPNENEKNICQNPQLVEVEKKEERMIETIQTNNTILLSTIDRLKSNCKVVHCHSLPAASTMFMSIFGP